MSSSGSNIDPEVATPLLEKRMLKPQKDKKTLAKKVIICSKIVNFAALFVSAIKWRSMTSIGFLVGMTGTYIGYYFLYDDNGKKLSDLRKENKDLKSEQAEYDKRLKKIEEALSKNPVVITPVPVSSNYLGRR